MRYSRLIASVAAAGLMVSISARAAFSDFDITFAGGGITGAGEIQATANGGGSYTAVSGSFTITSGSGSYNYAGATASLVPTTDSSFSGSTWVVYGGTDFFPVDNLVYPGQRSLLTQGGSSFANNNGGLAFNDPSFTGPGGSGLAFVIYANAGGAGGYGIVFNGAGNQPWADEHDGGTVTLTAVPEPTSLISCALMVLPFGASALRILRRKAWVEGFSEPSAP